MPKPFGCVFFGGPPETGGFPFENPFEKTQPKGTLKNDRFGTL